MERTLIIRQFGAIISAEINLKNLTVFIGEQGSGKSTIAKLITIFENNAFQLQAENTIDLMVKFDEFNIASYFHADTYLSYNSEKGNITYEDGSFHYNPSNVESLYIPAATPDMNSMFIASTAQNTHSLYIPAERFFISTFSRSIATLVLAKAPIPQTLLEFASLYEKAKNQFVTYQIPIFNMTFQTRDMSEKLVLNDSNTVIPFKDASSGIQSAIPLLMVIDYVTKEHANEHFVVEEPELNLFPQSQVDLLHHIVSKRKPLTITTHSPYLLSALNNMILADNVLKTHPEKENEITALVPRDCMVDFNNVAAYKIDNGYVVSILDEEYSIIVADQIDSISDKESRIFSALLDIE